MELMEFDNEILNIFIKKKLNNDVGDIYSNDIPYGEANIEDVMRTTMKLLNDEIKNMPPGFADQQNQNYLLILRYESALREYRDKKKDIDKMFGTPKDEKDNPGTARQSALAFYYMQQAKAFPRKSGIKEADAKFIRFLTGHNLKSIKNVLSNPDYRKNDKTGRGTKTLIDDLKKVLNQFEIIGFIDGMKLIENKIKTLQNDLDTFNEK